MSSSTTIFSHVKSGHFYQADDMRMVLKSSPNAHIPRAEFICNDVQRLLILTIFFPKNPDSADYAYIHHMLTSCLGDPSFLGDEAKEAPKSEYIEKHKSFLWIYSIAYAYDSIHSHEKSDNPSTIGSHKHFKFRNCDPFTTMEFILKYMASFPKKAVEQQERIKQIIYSPSKDEVIAKAKELKKRKLLAIEGDPIREYKEFCASKMRGVDNLIIDRKYATALKFCKAYLSTHPETRESEKNAINRKIAICEQQITRANRCRLLGKSLLAFGTVALAAVTGYTKLTPSSAGS